MSLVEVVFILEFSVWQFACEFQRALNSLFMCSIWPDTGGVLEEVGILAVRSAWAGSVVAICLAEGMTTFACIEAQMLSATLRKKISVARRAVLVSGNDQPRLRAAGGGRSELGAASDPAAAPSRFLAGQ